MFSISVSNEVYDSAGAVLNEYACDWKGEGRVVDNFFNETHVFHSL